MNIIKKGKRMELSISKKKPFHEPNQLNLFLDTFYSVEFQISGLDFIHQFKIFKTEDSSMIILAKEGSSIIKAIKEGDTIPMKYYSFDTLCPTKVMNTRIKGIKKEDQGRFLGHYVVQLSIEEETSRELFH